MPQKHINTGKITNVAEKNLGERVIEDLSQTLKNKNYHIYISKITSKVTI